MFLGISRDLLELAIGHRTALAQALEISTEGSSEGELAAMVSFAIAFPDGFMALVDTYDVKRYFAFRHNSLGLKEQILSLINQVEKDIILHIVFFFIHLIYYRFCC